MLDELSLLCSIQLSAPAQSLTFHLQTLLDKAAKALEKYFFLVSFAGFVETSEGLRGKFSDWLRVRRQPSFHSSTRSEC
jgi:hypothetical protein